VAAPRETASIDPPWTDLAQLADDVPPGRNALAGRVLARLVEALTAFAEHGFDPFRDAFARYDVLAGRNVRVLTAGATRTALALGVDAHGALRLRDGNGEFVVTSGEVSVRTGDEA
jgi:BirA family biotin operon repressor/biotin-[acetyl-CoA-carboxylase] ligase